MSNEEEELVRLVNGLSDAAVWMCSRHWFGQVIHNKSVLAHPENDAQQAVFDELLSHGLVHGDVEQGIEGYRSTWRGRRVAALCREVVRRSMEKQSDA